MAVQWQFDEEEDAAASPSQGAQTSSGGGTVGGAGGQVGQVPQADTAQGTSSGSYTNLQKYVDGAADRGFSEQLAGNLQSDADQGSEQLQQLGDQYRTNVNANQIDFSEDFAGRIGGGYANELDQADKDQAELLRTGSYQSPGDFGGTQDADDPYGQLRKHFAKTQQTEGIGTSTGGQKALLEQYYGRDNYTQGEKGLDAQILGQNSAPIEQANQSLQDFNVNYGETRDELRGLESESRTNYGNEQTEFRDYLGLDDSGNLRDGTGLIGERLSDADKRVSDLQAQSSLAAKGEGKINDLSRQYEDLNYFNQFSPGQIQTLDFDTDRFRGQGDENLFPGPGEIVPGDVLPGNRPKFANEGDAGGWQRYVEGNITDRSNYDSDYLYGLNPGSEEYYDAINEGNINRGSASYQQQVDDVNALAGLAGQQDFIVSPNVGDYKDGLGYEFNKDRYVSAVNDKGQAYRDAGESFTKGQEGGLSRYGAASTIPRVQDQFKELQRVMGLEQKEYLDINQDENWYLDDRGQVRPQYR